MGPRSAMHGNVRFAIQESGAKTNWVGKSSDFTNPFVCGPAGGKVKKMSSSSVSHMSTTIHTPKYQIVVILEPV